MAQHPNRYPSVPGEISDTQHDATCSMGSHCVRVKTIVRQGQNHRSRSPPKPLETPDDVAFPGQKMNADAHFNAAASTRAVLLNASDAVVLLSDILPRSRRVLAADAVRILGHEHHVVRPSLKARKVS